MGCQLFDELNVQGTNPNCNNNKKSETCQPLVEKVRNVIKNSLCYNGHTDVLELIIEMLSFL